MSLINEALKKAQRQRSLDAAPLSSAPSGVAAAAVTTHVRAASHKRSLAPLWFGLGVLALGAGTTALVMRYGFDSGKNEPAGPVALAPVAPPPPASAPVAAPASAPEAPAVSVTSPAGAAAPAAPMVVLPPIPAATPNTPASPPAPAAHPAPAASAPAIARSAPSPAPAVSTPTTPVAPVAPAASSQVTVPLPESSAPAPAPVTPVAAAPSPAEREAKIYAFLNTLRLTGVRGLDRDARVLMNERVWRLNDIVAPELGLRLSAVRPNLLVFTDAQGKTYEKPH